MPGRKCAEYSRLEHEVEFTLRQVKEITTAQLDAFQSHDQDTVMRLDKELEKAMGRKERSLGALRQHAKDHKCWPPG
jgi:hypothetical protein